MRETGKFSMIGFKYALISISFLLLALLIIILGVVESYQIGTYLVGITILISCLLAIVGLINSLKGIKEPITIKKILGLFINFGMSVVLLLVFVMNFINIYKAFN